MVDPTSVSTVNIGNSIHFPDLLASYCRKCDKLPYHPRSDHPSVAKPPPELFFGTEYRYYKPVEEPPLDSLRPFVTVLATSS